MSYALRKPLSIFKYYIESEFHLSKGDLGWVDVALLLPYSFVQIFGANFWHSFPSHCVLALNLFMAALFILLSGLAHDYSVFCLLVALSGVFQAPLWPNCIKSLQVEVVEENALATHVGILGSAPYAGAAFRLGPTYLMWQCFSEQSFSSSVSGL